MKNFLFYLITVLIWGSTWIGIKFQLGTIHPMVSVGYRFALASLLLLLWCLICKLPMHFSRQQHFFMALQGLLLFSLNYLLFYMAELQLTSGLAAVIFSTILLMNMINGSLLLNTPIDRKVVLGGTVGLIGIFLVFLPEITVTEFGTSQLKGIILCFVATYLASLGNILSARNQKNALPIIQTNAYGMGYGAIFMLFLALITGKSLQIDYSLIYFSSLLYLSIFGSIIAFGCYLALVGSIGPDRAAYATLLFPLVALIISTLFEGYSWTGGALMGVTLIVCGNVMMLQRNKNPQAATLSFKKLRHMFPTINIFR